MLFSDLPNPQRDAVALEELAQLMPRPLDDKPRILLLYGSLRKRTYSRLLLGTRGPDTNGRHLVASRRLLAYRPTALVRLTRNRSRRR